MVNFDVAFIKAPATSILHAVQRFPPRSVNLRSPTSMAPARMVPIAASSVSAISRMGRRSSRSFQPCDPSKLVWHRARPSASELPPSSGSRARCYASFSRVLRSLLSRDFDSIPALPSVVKCLPSAVGSPQRDRRKTGSDGAGIWCPEVDRSYMLAAAFGAA